MLTWTLLPPFEPPPRTVGAGLAGRVGVLGLFEPFEPPLREVVREDVEEVDLPPPRRAVLVFAFGFQPVEAGFELPDDDLLPPLRVVLDVLLVDLLPPERTVGLRLVTRVMAGLPGEKGPLPASLESGP